MTFEPQWQDEDTYSVGALALAPSDHNVVWLGSGEGDPRNPVSYGPGNVYWGGNVVFRSRDYGHSWDVISPDLTTDDPAKQLDSGGEIYNDNTAAEFHTTILTIAESEVEAGVIWVGTDDGNVQITRDDGASWTNVRDRVPGLPADVERDAVHGRLEEAGSDSQHDQERQLPCHRGSSADIRARAGHHTPDHQP